MELNPEKVYIARGDKVMKYRLNKVRGAIISRAKERPGPLSSTIIHTLYTSNSEALQYETGI